MNERILDHVGIAVPSIDAALPTWARINDAPAGPPEVLESQGVEVVFLGHGPGRIELLAPLRADSPIARFLERRGPGIHHLAYRVPDIRASLTNLATAGFELIDSEPRVGAGNHLVAFVHPKSTAGVLIELVETSP